MPQVWAGWSASRHCFYRMSGMEASLALSGQVAGRIESVEPVADIIRRCANDCRVLLGELADRYADRGS